MCLVDQAMHLLQILYVIASRRLILVVLIRKSIISRQPIMEPMESFVVQAAVMIATHQVIPFDLAIVDTCDGQRIFSFLCIEWGIIADVDCDSEQYRFLGKNRISSFFFL
jgi:hypothetical protein